MAIDLNISDTQITDILEKAINKRVKEKFNEGDFINKVSALINQKSQEYLNAKIQELDIDNKITEKVNDYFNSAINVQTNNNQLTVMDDMTVIENELITKALTVDKDMVIKGSLSLRGAVNTDAKAWSELKDTIRKSVVADLKRYSQKELVQEVKTAISKEGIELKDIDVNGDALVDSGQLSRSIKYSALQEVGTLKDLTVKGEVSMNNDTLNVLNTRIGINTAKPTKAMDIWDQDIQITIGREEKGVGYIGTSNQARLRIGTANNADIEINNGVVEVQKFKIGRNIIAWDTKPPGHSGAPGDIIFNAGSIQCAGWRCVDKFNWSKF
tara:strand:+ start:127 stop:1107 length:981 start_codon:yes stop_codon:yes gene_type:complete